MEVNLSRLQETILEVVQVEEHRIRIESRLWIAVREVELTGSTQLHIGQFADSTFQQFLFLQRITASCLASPSDGVKQRHIAQVSLDVAQLIVANSKYLRHWQLSSCKVTGQIDKGVILVATGADASDDTLTLDIGHSIVFTIAA